MAGNRKKARKPKKSEGIHGGGGKLTQPMSHVQKVLLGKGMYQSRKPFARERTVD